MKDGPVYNYACRECDRCEIALSGTPPEGLVLVCPVCSGTCWWVVKTVRRSLDGLKELLHGPLDRS